MLAIAGKFPGNGYTDIRVTTDDPYNDTVKPYNDYKDKCDMNLGRMPLLTVGDTAIGQSDCDQLLRRHGMWLVGQDCSGSRSDHEHCGLLEGVS